METAQKQKKSSKGKRSMSRAKRQVIRTGQGFLYGDLLSSAFFNKYKIPVMTIIALFMLYITYKYECQTHMETIARLQKELTIVKSECIREQSTYKSSTRESAMQHRIDSLKLSLRPQAKPPYKINYSTR